MQQKGDVGKQLLVDFSSLMYNSPTSGPLTFGLVTLGSSLVHAAEPEALSHGPLTASVKASPEPSTVTSTSQIAAETGQLCWIVNFCLGFWGNVNVSWTLISAEELFNEYVNPICSCLLLNPKGHEESSAVARPYLPLTAMTKTSPDAPAAPQEPAGKSAEQPAKCGAQQGAFSCAFQGSSLCEQGVSLKISLTKTLLG